MIDADDIRSNYSCRASPFEWSPPIHCHTYNYMPRPRALTPYAAIEHPAQRRSIGGREE
jgi:hypothetical protein